MTVFFSKKEKIGELLVRQRKLQPNQLERALTHLESVPQGLGEILVSLGFISEDDLLAGLAEQLCLSIYAPQEEDTFLPLNIAKIFLRDHPFAMIRRGEKNILICHDPLDGDILSTAETQLNEPFEIQLVLETDVKKMVGEHYDLGLKEQETEKYIIDEADVDKLKDMASEAPVIKYVNNLVDTAVNRRASDIHIESFEGGQLIRFRIDGILQDFEMPPLSMQAAIISRTKLLAALDIAERRIPQDGKISMRIGGKEIDLRVSTMPTIYGEGVVIRILEKGSIILDMGHLGMGEEIEKQFKELISYPNGIILVTGPTGSGKTTTLYCALNQINSGHNKIITLEDPVEYQLKGINQTQVRPEIGLTFAKGLRSIVRQDPDIIMVGEIRDLDTAEIAVQSSLTGHLVFSTLHTNDALSAVTRLIDIGVENFLISSALRGVLAQRLVRRICQHCRTKQGHIAEHLGYLPEGDDFEMYTGIGCASCSGTGYSGRIGIYELLVMSDVLCRAVAKRKDLGELKRIAVDEGFKEMFHDGLLKIKEGRTTLAEVIRVSRGATNAAL
ncbi:MAG: Flp pilus assembly complex ATPase component TadA [Proteobacteria bacterium]|nr:Flp pilus assembly complex ATPase component TadA [Pseudomonadota bacterium]MBU4298011.1 Flp pilus assembly complex ATPase component TadA [Pseudomonadota bacterium]MCG2749571.1 Flp pilus assembly complex ATPase component TadA [Desulfobulbaceae bacterium]